MFLILLELKSEEGYEKSISDKSISKSYLGEMHIRIENYFPSLLTQVYDWVQNPYSESASHPENVTLKE